MKHPLRFKVCWTAVFTVLIFQIACNGTLFDSLMEEPDTAQKAADPDSVIAQLSGLPHAENTDTALNVTVSGSNVDSYKYKLLQSDVCGSGGYSDFIDTDTAITDSLSGANGETYILCVIGRHTSSDTIQAEEEDEAAITSFSFVTDNTAPAVPAVLPSSATDITTNGYTFTWTNPADTDEVFIQIATDSTFTDIVVGSAADVSVGTDEQYIYDMDRTVGASYYARVKVVDDVGNDSGFGTASGEVRMVGSVTGRVRENGASWLNGATVTLKTYDGTVLGVTTTANVSGNDGTYVFDPVPVTSGVSGEGHRITITASSFEDGGASGIQVAPGAAASAPVAYLQPTGGSAGTITGQVIDSDYTGTPDPLQNAMVTIYDYESNVVDTQTTDVNGDFTSISLAAGTYSLLIELTGYNDFTIPSVAVDGNVDLDKIGLVAQLTAGTIKILLQWGASPADLDIFVVGSKTPTYGSVKYITYWGTLCYNDADDTTPGSPCGEGVATQEHVFDIVSGGYGPEGTYIYPDIYKPNEIFINVQSNANWVEAETTEMRVEIYDDSGQIAYIPFPTWVASTKWWQVAKIVLTDGQDPDVIVKGRLFDASGEPPANWDVCGTASLCWND